MHTKSPQFTQLKRLPRRVSQLYWAKGSNRPLEGGVQTTLSIISDCQHRNLDQSTNQQQLKSHQATNYARAAKHSIFFFAHQSPLKNMENVTLVRKANSLRQQKILESGKTKCFSVIATVENRPLSDCNRSCLSVSTTRGGSSMNGFSSLRYF